MGTSFVKCNADRIYKVQAETIEERAKIWSECASVKAKQFAIIIAIVATIIIIKVIYDEWFSKEKESLLPFLKQNPEDGSNAGLGKILLYIAIGAGATAISYYLTLYLKNSEVKDFLDQWAIAKRNKPGINADEFVKDMEIRDLRQREIDRRSSSRYERESGRRGSISTSGISLNF